ncbi:MaoC family dehydratase [uncultured Thiothrix sp.]|uniref:MaoC family dehydratase n=1 Tax=uncultured Thiothrix sp. TaxID=223185 RepID=UPI002637C55A|nr:MaoC family dehydratase [uncultured Thiothrix sp.]HMT91566.1 MaoC family dehydratase [Thiolinea sp.]
MKFAEFYNGQVIETGLYKVSEEEILQFAQAYDPQWFHVDPEASKQGRFGSLIASGWHTCGIAMKLLVPAALAGSESFASPGLKYVKWPNPVRPNDELSLQATVLDVRRSSSRPSMGILHWRWQLFNQDGAEVLDLEATSLFDLS